MNTDSAILDTDSTKEVGMSLDAHDLKKLADSAKTSKPVKKRTKQKYKFNQSDIDAHIDVMEELVQKQAKKGHVVFAYDLYRFLQDPALPAEDQPNTVPADRLKAFIVVLATEFASRHQHFLTTQDTGGYRVVLDWSGEREC